MFTYQYDSAVSQNNIHPIQYQKSVHTKPLSDCPDGCEMKKWKYPFGIPQEIIIIKIKAFNAVLCDQNFSG